MLMTTSIKVLLRRSAARRFKRGCIWVRCMFGCGLLRAGDIQDRIKQRISSTSVWGKLFFITWFRFHIGRNGSRTELDGRIGISWMGLHAILGWSFRLLLLPTLIKTIYFFNFSHCCGSTQQWGFTSTSSNATRNPY